jgi:restriction system protein
MNPSEGTPAHSSHTENEVVIDLEGLDGHDFEAAMIMVFQRMGYQTERGKLANDEGRDIILRRADQLIVVECKHQKAAIGRPVIQKLHSAVITYRNASSGLVVATSSFSAAAYKYLEEVNAGSNLKIEVWDYERLVREAREARVYFVTSSQKIFFRVPWRTRVELEMVLRNHHIDGIQSRPRKISAVVHIPTIALEIVPALLVDYTVDKQFQTQAGFLYHARDTGRKIYGVGGHAIGVEEQEAWRNSQPVQVFNQEIEGKALPMYFGEPT